MKKIWVVLFLAVVALALVSCGSAPSNAGVSQEEYDSLKGQYDTLQNDYNELQTEYDPLKGKYETLQDDYSALQTEYDSLKADLDSANKQIDDLLSMVAEAEQDAALAAPSADPSTEPSVSQPVATTTSQRAALSKAKSYLAISAFSYDGLVGQLEYEEFSHEDAVYAVDNCGADWNEQAAKKAESYLSIMSFSRNKLIDQLEYEGFTHEQAVYGVEQNGY